MRPAHWTAAALASAVALAGCRKVTQPPVGEASLADSAEQVLFDVHSVLTDHGVKSGDMYADTVYVFNDQTKFVLRRVRAAFNTETGAPNGTLKGDRGIYDLRTQTLEGFGHVVVLSTDGRKLESNHLKYAQALNQVSSDSAFTLTRKSEVQRGIGFASDPNLSRFKCFLACRGEALVPLKGLANP